MPLFKSHAPAPAPAPEPEPKHGLFHRSHSPPRAAEPVHDNASHRSGSIFGSRKSISPSRDPSVTAARQRVQDAQNAERQADAALAQARLAVREAREHVKIIEREAVEEYVSSLAVYSSRWRLPKTAELAALS